MLDAWASVHSGGFPKTFFKDLLMNDTLLEIVYGNQAIAVCFMSPVSNLMSVIIGITCLA